MLHHQVLTSRHADTPLPFAVCMWFVHFPGTESLHEKSNIVSQLSQLHPQSHYVDRKWKETEPGATGLVC